MNEFAKFLHVSRVAQNFVAPNPNDSKTKFIQNSIFQRRELKRFCHPVELNLKKITSKGENHSHPLSTK